MTDNHDRLIRLEATVEALRQDVMELREEVRRVLANDQQHLTFLLRVLAALAVAGAFGASAGIKIVQLLLGGG